MPINGLTNRPGRLTEIGRIYKGAPKGEKAPGKDLDYFRFKGTDADANAAWLAAYPTPEAARRIKIFMPYAQADQNFSAFRELRNKVGLVHRCDGDLIWDYDQSGKLAQTDKPCPCKGMPDRVGDNNAINPAKCRPVGRLMMIVEALDRLGYVLFSMTSMIDITRLSTELTAIEQTIGQLQGIPLILTRRPESISSPTTNGSRAAITRNMCHVEVDPEWSRPRLAAMRSSAILAAGHYAPQLQAPSALALPAPYVAPALIEHGDYTINETTGEILDDDEAEYWPDDDDRAPVGAPEPQPEPAAEFVPLLTPAEIKQAWRNLEKAGVKIPPALWKEDLNAYDEKRTRAAMAWIAGQQAKIDNATKK
jgi:hypothetical protein